jgi:hypothetical protein
MRLLTCGMQSGPGELAPPTLSVGVFRFFTDRSHVGERSKRQKVFHGRRGKLHGPTRKNRIKVPCGDPSTQVRDVAGYVSQIRRRAQYISRTFDLAARPPHQFPLTLRADVGQFLCTYSAICALIDADVTPISLSNDRLTTLAVIAHLQGHGDTAFAYETLKTPFQFLRFRLGRGPGVSRKKYFLRDSRDKGV